MSKQIHDESRRESGRKTQVRFRVDEELLDQYDRWVTDSELSSRSEALRTSMRKTIAGGSLAEYPQEPPRDDEVLRTAYVKLYELCNADGVIRHDLAVSELASVLGKRKKVVEHMVLEKLSNRGYIGQTVSFAQNERSWKLRGWEA